MPPPHRAAAPCAAAPRAVPRVLVREEHEPVLPVEAAVLQDQRHVVFARRKFRGLFFLVADEKKSGQAEVDLPARAAVGMRVKPVGARPILDLELVDVTLPGGGGVARMPVHVLGHVQTVPMDVARLVETVLEVETHPLPFADADDGPEIAVGNRLHARGVALHDFAAIGPDPGSAARQDGSFPFGCGQGNFHVGSAGRVSTGVSCSRRGRQKRKGRSQQHGGGRACASQELAAVDSRFHRFLLSQKIKLVWRNPHRRS